MQWGSVENFLAMGGYGFYVWGSYLMCAAVIVAEIVMVRARRRRALSDARAYSQRPAAKVVKGV
jgi:heme exporter protein D